MPFRHGFDPAGISLYLHLLAVRDTVIIRSVVAFSSPLWRFPYYLSEGDEEMVKSLNVK